MNDTSFSTTGLVFRLRGNGRAERVGRRAETRERTA